MPELAKFWSDDFDMDLLKLWPDLPAQLGETANVKLWTVGHETYGRLNHPCTWNTHYGALVWLDKPHLFRDQHGWFCVDGHSANEPLIECTWLELLRDQWPHRYSFVLMPSRRIFEGCPVRDFDRVLYHIRGWNPDPDIEQTKEICFAWVMKLTRQLEGIIKGAVS